MEFNRFIYDYIVTNIECQADIGSPGQITRTWIIAQHRHFGSKLKDWVMPSDRSMRSSRSSRSWVSARVAFHVRNDSPPDAQSHLALPFLDIQSGNEQERKRGATLHLINRPVIWVRQRPRRPLLKGSKAYCLPLLEPQRPSKDASLVRR